MPFAEDLDQFLSVREFATPATLIFGDGDNPERREVVGIFDEPFLDAELGEYDLDTTQPRLLCKEADVRGLGRYDRVEIAGRVFDVMSLPQVDGTGMATVRLSPVSGQGRR